MKKLVSMKLILALLFCSPLVAVAQSPANCDLLRSKIAELETLEKSEVANRSPSIQRTYKEALLKIYKQFGECLQDDISALTDMKRAVEGTDAAPAIAEKLQALTTEKINNDGKLAKMRTALNLPATDTATAQPDASANGGNGGGETSVAAAATPSPAPVQSTFTCAPGAAYDDAPPLLTDIVSRDAADAVNRNNATRAIASAQKMILYTVIDAASPSSSKLLRSLEAYQYLSDTARTDKQLGGSPKSDGAVSAIEKPGFASLLGFAVEHGAINKKNDGTNLTLSTSLYSLYAMKNGDTAETYDRAGILNRIGVAATFAVANKTNDLANATRNNLSEWSVKARLFGDRSTRSPIFRKFWDSDIRPLINQRLQAIGGAIEGLSSEDRIPGFSQFREDVERCLLDHVRQRMSDADYKAAKPDDQKKILSDLMLGYLNANVFARVKDGRLQVKPEAITLIETQYVPNLQAAVDNLKSARGELAKKLEDLKKSPLGTFAYTNHRQPNASDYSETKFLFEQEKGFMGPLKLTGNFGLSFYHRPNLILKQQKLRDVSAALSFEGSTASPFTESENQSKVTYSFVGSYERLFENRRLKTRKPDIGTVQFVVEIPFVKGFSLPFSLSYANATEEERKRNVKFNFGMRLDTDKLFDLLKAASSH